MPDSILTKTCNACNINKPFSEFWKMSTGKYGLHSECKACIRARKKAYRATDKGRAVEHLKRQRYLAKHGDEMRARMLARKAEPVRPEELPSERICTKCGILKPASEFRVDRRFHILESRCRGCSNVYAKNYSQTEQGKISNILKVRKHKRAHPEQVMAGNAARKVKRDHRRVCSRCGAMSDRLQKHHWSYEKEHWLDVEWLCIPCHKLTHSRQNNA